MIVNVWLFAIKITQFTAWVGKFGQPKMKRD